jgi:hypothetical protein
MKECLGRLSLPGLSVLLAVLILASMGWAQSSDGTMPAGLAGTMLMFVVVMCLAGYVYVALALQTIATKTNTENAWLAWIPIANIFLMLSIAKKPMWWFILFLVPLANIVVAIMVWMAVAEARNKPNWWGILTIVPVVNIVVPGYLAWSD